MLAKIALLIALFGCLLLIVFGIVIWFFDEDFIIRLMFSMVSLFAGIGLGACGIEEFIQEFLNK